MAEGSHTVPSSAEETEVSAQTPIPSISIFQERRNQDIASEELPTEPVTSTPSLKESLQKVL